MQLKFLKILSYLFIWLSVCLSVWVLPPVLFCPTVLNIPQRDKMSETWKHCLHAIPKLPSMAMLYVRLSLRMFSLCLICVLLSTCFHFCHQWPAHFSVFICLSFKILLQFIYHAFLSLIFSPCCQTKSKLLYFSIIYLVEATVFEELTLTLHSQTKLGEVRVLLKGDNSYR